MSDEPDKFDIARYHSQMEEIKKGYRGATHAMNKAHAECESLARGNQELRETVTKLRADLDDSMAEIGKLRELLRAEEEWRAAITERVSTLEAELAETSQALKDARDAYRELKK